LVAVAIGNVCVTLPELTMRASGNAGIAAGALLAIAAVLLVLWFALRSEARALLERLGLPRGTVEVGDVRVVGPDGPMPEIASRSFRVPGDEPTLKSFYLERCRLEGLSDPEPAASRLEPDLLCQRLRAGRAEAVYSSARCEQQSCGVSLEVRY
jgi:hypothetical protein